eukprot:CAMPEP_0203820146 /NCGR_PEP_ID=MMETSP0115-20131106/38728_1 /ASSEMBLY_ACC=CAM_ASM_000227 /TAXON_ID=33651 /ORGANISM="Bicosoecid sp, Strain ms1" /LENGTH=69 /DNA_ID=CAMNT_0050729147 /DNA_START=39 /DNA_END=245 /DNA_ORIENTATION=+
MVYCVVVSVKVKAEKVDEALAQMVELQRQTCTTEEGCIMYSYGQDAKDPTTILLQERYVSEEAFGVHMS